MDEPTRFTAERPAPCGESRISHPLRDRLHRKTEIKYSLETHLWHVRNFACDDTRLANSTCTRAMRRGLTIEVHVVRVRVHLRRRAQDVGWRSGPFSTAGGTTNETLDQRACRSRHRARRGDRSVRPAACPQHAHAFRRRAEDPEGRRRLSGQAPRRGDQDAVRAVGSIFSDRRTAPQLEGQERRPRLCRRAADRGLRLEGLSGAG